MTEAQKKVYMLTFFLVMIFILYFWVLPYVIGAVISASWYPGR